MNVSRLSSHDHDAAHQWDAFLTRDPYAVHDALQSWAWGDFQQALGRAIDRWIVRDEATVRGVALVVRHVLPLQREFFFSPRGPVIDDTHTWKIVRDNISFRDVARSAHAVWWRVEPLIILADNDLRRVKDVEPQATAICDLTKTHDELLAALSLRTRYNMRLAERKGVEIRIWNHTHNPDWERLAQTYYTLLTETAERHHLYIQPQKYFSTMLAILGEAKMLEVAQSMHKGDCLNMSIHLRFGNTHAYVHGAATRKKQQYKASALHQWRVMMHAKKAGLHWYDFFGVSSNDNPRHPFAGVTQFKMGFGATRYRFPGTFELPLAPFEYRAIQILQALRRCQGKVKMSPLRAK